MGTAGRIALNAVIVSLAVFGGFYQIYLKPLLATFGVSPARVVNAIGNKHCIVIPELKACEGELPKHLPALTLFHNILRKYSSPTHLNRLLRVLDAGQPHALAPHTRQVEQHRSVHG
jgi:hypothetical protein